MSEANVPPLLLGDVDELVVVVEVVPRGSWHERHEREEETSSTRLALDDDRRGVDLPTHHPGAMESVRGVADIDDDAEQVEAAVQPLALQRGQAGPQQLAVGSLHDRVPRPAR